MIAERELARVEDAGADLRLVTAEEVEFEKAAKADNTWRAYAQDWAGFTLWLTGVSRHAEKGVWLDACREALGATVSDVKRYIREALEVGVPALVRDGSGWRVELHTHKPASIARRISGISQGFLTSGAPNPCADPSVKRTLAAARRKYAEVAGERHEPIVKRVAAADRDTLIRMLCSTDRDTNRMRRLRDRALLLIGMAGALRRSELVALHAADLEFGPDGLVITIRRSKTGQDEQQEVRVCYGSGDVCPIRALQDWTGAAGIIEGPLFRPVNRHQQVAATALSGSAVAEIVRRHAAGSGLNPKDFGGHSLRAGFITQAACAGAGLHEIMEQSRHKTPAVAMGYIRRAKGFDNPALKLW